MKKFLVVFFVLGLLFVSVSTQAKLLASEKRFFQLIDERLSERQLPNSSCVQKIRTIVVSDILGRIFKIQQTVIKCTDGVLVKK